MSTPTLVTGDDFNLIANLTVNNIAMPLTGSTITAAVVSIGHETLIMAAVAQPEGNAGSDWANGVVGIDFNKSHTAAITAYGMAYLEIQVAGVTTNTWFVPVNVIKGNIA